MKKKLALVLIALVGMLAVFLVGKSVLRPDNQAKPTVNVTVYTLSASDTEKWERVKQVETSEGLYLIQVKEASSSEEIFSNIIADGGAMGFGVPEAEVRQFNDNLGETIEDSKKNKLIGLEFLTFDNADQGFVIANFDLGEEFSAQKKGRESLYKALYDAYKD